MQAPWDEGIEIMDIIKYAKLVQQVRQAQSDYFKHRKQSDLIRSKNLERQLDLQTEKILKHAEVLEAEQLTLLGGEQS
jgi:hypothetical protein